MNISRRFRKGISALMAATVFCVTTMGNITPADPIIVARSSASNAAKASRANARKASASEALPLDEDGLLMDGVLINDLEIQADEKQDRPVLMASLVDEFGNSIDDRYNQIPVKVDGELLPLDDPDTPPVKDVYVKTGFFGLKKRSYHFVEATADGSIITAVRLQEKDGEDEEQSASAAETQTVATGSNAQKRAAKTRQKSWFYTENGLDWTEITEDTELLFVYAPENRTVFEYEDEDVVVTAVTEKEDALPAGAELVVKPVKRDSAGYNYQAYLDALNQKAAEENAAEQVRVQQGEEAQSAEDRSFFESYSDQNTMLYDIAFMTQETGDDEEIVTEGDGNAAVGADAMRLVEVQPEEGAVKISFRFKKRQVSTDLGVASTDEMKVHHMPLKEEIQDTVNSTSDAVGIRAEDIAPETLEIEAGTVSANAEEEKVEFKTESFSMYALAAAPVKAPKQEEEKPFRIQLYGFNFGGRYKNSRYSEEMVIGYSKDLDPVSDHLTFKKSDLLETPFTYSSEGFDIENVGLIQEEQNTNTGYKYEVVGFLPVEVKTAEALSVNDYHSNYVFSSRDEAEQKIRSCNGVLYGKTPTGEFASSLESGNAALAVWLQKEPRRLTGISFYTVTPSKLALEKKKNIAVTIRLSGCQAGDYTDDPIPFRLLLSDGLKFSSDNPVSFATTKDIVCDQNNLNINESRNTVEFNINELKKNGYLNLKLNLVLDVESNTTTESMIAFINNKWIELQSSKKSISIDRPTVSVKLDGKSSRDLDSVRSDQKVSLEVKHGGQKNGTANASVTIKIPENVVLKTAEPNQTNKNTITGFAVDTEKGIISYNVTNFKNNASDLFTLTVDPCQLEDGQENRSEPVVCEVFTDAERVNKALETSQASFNVLPHYSVVFYGTLMAWEDQTKDRGGGDNLWAADSNKTIKSKSKKGEHPLAEHVWSFEDKTSPLYEISEVDHNVGSSSVTRVGEHVLNKWTNTYWTCVGFVPIQAVPSGQIYDSYNLKYHSASMEEAVKTVTDMNGILYGDTLTKEQADSWDDLWDTKSNGKKRVMTVWYVSKGSDEYQKYQYPNTLPYYTNGNPDREPVAFEPTTKGVDVSTRVEKVSRTHQSITITYTIPEDIKERELNFCTAFENIVVNAQPGDTLEYHVKVIDNSRKFRYLEGSGAEGTLNYSAGISSENTAGYGFEGFPISKATNADLSTYARRLMDGALKDLSKHADVQFNIPTDEAVGEALFKLGYGSSLNNTNSAGRRSRLLKSPVNTNDVQETDENPDYAAITQEYLDDYYLDWFNDKYYDAHTKEDASEPHFKSFSDLGAEEYMVLFRGANATQIAETNPIVVNSKYFAFYEYFYTVSESGSDGTYVGSYTWMANKNKNGGNNFDSVIKGQWGEDYKVEHNISWTELINGEANGNAMMNTKFFVAVQFKLIREPFSVRKIWYSSDGRDVTKDADVSKPDSISFMLFRKKTAIINDEVSQQAEKDPKELNNDLYSPIDREGHLLSTEMLNTGACVYQLSESSIASVTGQDGSKSEIPWAQIFNDLPGDARDYYALECSADGTKVFKDSSIQAELLDNQSWIDAESSDYWSVYESESSEFENAPLVTLNNRLHKVKVTKKWEDHGKTDVKHPDVTIKLTATEQVESEPAKATEEPAKAESVKTESGESEVVKSEAGEAENTKTESAEAAAEAAGGSGNGSLRQPESKVILSGSKSVEWDNLAGWNYETLNRIEYTADEGNISGYQKVGDPVSVTNGLEKEITFTNERLLTTFTVEKLWMQQRRSKSISSTIKNASATVQLCVGTKPDHSDAKSIDGETVTLPIEGSENPWSYTWENLDRYDDSGKELYYSAVETAASLNGRKFELGEDIKPYTSEMKTTGIFQIYNPLPTTSLSVEKHWMRETKDGKWEDISDSVQNSSVTLALKAYKKKKEGGRGEEVKLSENWPVILRKAPWTYTWENLDVYDENGTELVYTVEETDANLNGIVINLDAEDRKPVIKEVVGGIQIENPLPSTSLTVEKHWMKDGEDVTGTLENATAKLHLVIKGQNDAEDIGVEDIVLPVKDSETPWTYTWSGLKQFDDSGKKLEYAVEEISASIDGTALDIAKTNSPVISTLKDGTIRIENPMPKEPEQKPKTSVTVEKRWLRDGEDVTGTLKNATATLQLMRKGMSGAEDTVVGEIVLPVKNSETPWSYTWKDLPKYDDADRELTYQVVETAATYDGKDLELNPDYGKNGTTVLVSNVIPTPPTPDVPDRPYTPHHSSSGNPPKVTKQNRPKPEGSVLGVTREPEPVLPVPQVLGVGRLPRTGENSEAKNFDRVLAAGSTALILLLLCGAWALGKKWREQ